MSDRLIGIESSSQIGPYSSSMIRRLPPELLHIIFDAARRHPPSTTPFTLSHVCHEWRSFLLASPLLWTTVVVGQSFVCHFEYLDLWFQRSQNLDLSLYVHPVGYGRISMYSNDFFYIFSILGRSWKEIELPETICDIQDGLEDIVAWIIVQQIPKLTKLHIPRLKIHLPQSKDYELPSLENLESLAIHAGFLTLPPTSFSACSRLRQIYLRYDDDVSPPICFTSLYRIIQHVSPQLEDLRIQISGEVDRLVYVPPPMSGPMYPLETPNDNVSLPKLTELDLSWGPDNSRGHLFSALLRKLCTPNLVILRNFAVFILEKFNPPPGLTHLELTGHIFRNTAFPKTNIHAFFGTFSKLSNLRLVQFTLINWHDGEFATALLKSCPQLVHVGLHTCSSVNEADLRRLVEGRKVSEGMTCLQHLGVLNCKALVLDGEARTWFTVRLKTFKYEREML